MKTVQEIDGIQKDRRISVLLTNIKFKLYDYKDKLKKPVGIILIFTIVLSIFIGCFIDIRLPNIIQLEPEIAKQILNNRLSEIITVFCSSLGLFAIIFSIIQMKKDEIEVIQPLFFETYFLPFIGYSASSIIGLIIIDVLYSATCISDIVLIKVAVLSIYLIIIELLTVVFMIFRIYKLITTDFLFEKIMKDIVNAVSRNKFHWFNESDVILKKRIFENYSNSIISDNKLMYDKITDLIVKLQISHPDSFFTNDYSTYYDRLFMQVCQIDNYAAQKRIINIIANIMIEGGKSDNDIIINNIRHLPAFFYRNNILTKDISQHLVCQIFVVYRNIATKRDDLKNNKITEHILFSINQLFFSFILRNRSDDFIYSIEGFEYLSPFKYNSNLEGKSLVKFGLFAWILHQMMLKKISIDENNELNNVLKIEFKFLQLINMLKYFTKIDEYNDNDFLGWQMWSYNREEMSPLIPHSIPSTSSWLIEGLIFYFVKYNTFKNISTNLIDKIEDSIEFQHITYICKDSIASLLVNYDDTLSKITDINKEEFIQRLDIIKIFIEKLQKRHNFNISKTIANLPLSDLKVNNFKEDIVKKWKQTQVVEAVFSKFGNITTKVSDSDKYCRSMPIKLKDWKKYFVEIDFDNPFLPAFGWDYSIQFDLQFISFLKDNKNYLALENLKEIDNYIELIKKGGLNPNIIIVDSELLFSDAFKPVYDDYSQPQKIIESSEAEYYYYNDIILLPIDNEYFKNTILIADFQASFEMNYYFDEDKKENQELRINVSIYSEEEAKNEILKEQIEMNQNNIINKMNNIILNISENFSFEIKNIDGFYILNYTGKSCQK